MKGIFSLTAICAAALVVGIVACGGAEKTPMTPDGPDMSPPPGSDAAAPAVPAADAGK